MESSTSLFGQVHFHFKGSLVYLFIYLFIYCNFFARSSLMFNEKSKTLIRRRRMSRLI